MEDYFELTETPPQKKLPLLKFYLDDTLRRVLPALNVSSSDDYESVRAKLLSYLGGEKDPRIVRGQFFSRVQKAQEKTSAYMMELRRLSMSAFPHVAVKERDALVIDQFARGLSSKAIKATVVRARCTSAEEALEAATCEEGDLQVLHEMTASVRSLETREQQLPVGSGTPAEINELAERILDAVGQRSRTAGKQNPLGNGDHPQGPDKSVSKGMVCFNCGGRGHRAKQCPSPRTKSASEQKNKDPVRETGVSPLRKVMSVQQAALPLKGTMQKVNMSTFSASGESQRESVASLLIGKQCLDHDKQGSGAKALRIRGFDSTRFLPGINDVIFDGH
ncbi:hypothetical protein M514_24660 [Trichuris suis]|uniref:CCHC-type domain-containing protein n=1 Tax=Trichuris suis TaxID=68888 RepID=A0A085N139_9BILA|nr:hypothetical protein M514_24660 [Trichuris suis]